MFLSEFDLQILYKPDKSHIISDVLNCLSNHNDTDKCLNALDINMFNVYNDSVMIISEDFNKHVQKTYEKDIIWVSILEMLCKSETKSDIDFAFQNNLIHYKKNSDSRLCISVVFEKKMFKMIHDDNIHED